MANREDLETSPVERVVKILSPRPLRDRAAVGSGRGHQVAESFCFFIIHFLLMKEPSHDSNHQYQHEWQSAKNLASQIDRLDHILDGLAAC